MSGFPIVDLVIGMIFIYFLLSIICSSAVEMILTVKQIRAKILEKWLLRIFDKNVTLPDGKTLPLGQAIMDHCSVTALAAKGTSPSYIDAKNFTSALLEKITFDPANPKSIATTFDAFITSLQNTQSLSTEFQRVLIAYAYEAKDTYQSVSAKTISELEIFRTKVENWYDSSMDRLTGVLKKNHSRPATIAVAIAASLLLNADSISLARYLYTNPDARARIVAQASEAMNDSLNKKYNTAIAALHSLNDSSGDKQIIAAYKQNLDNIANTKALLAADLPLGWNGNVFNDARGAFSPWLILSKICGLAATVLAMVMGAPFWFDLLNKVANLRGAGPKPLAAPNEDNKNT